MNGKRKMYSRDGRDGRKLYSRDRRDGRKMYSRDGRGTEEEPDRDAEKEHGKDGVDFSVTVRTITKLRNPTTEKPGAYLGCFHFFICAVFYFLLTAVRKTYIIDSNI